MIDNSGFSDEVLLAAEEAKPSKEASYWAKRSCKHCHGTGVAGVRVDAPSGGAVVRNEIACQCAVKKFTTWRNNFINDYLKNK